MNQILRRLNFLGCSVSAWQTKRATEKFLSVSGAAERESDEQQRATFAEAANTDKKEEEG